MHFAVELDQGSGEEPPGPLLGNSEPDGDLLNGQMPAGAENEHLALERRQDRRSAIDARIAVSTAGHGCFSGTRLR